MGSRKSVPWSLISATWSLIRMDSRKSVTWSLISVTWSLISVTWSLISFIYISYSVSFVVRGQRPRRGQ